MVRVIDAPHHSDATRTTPLDGVCRTWYLCRLSHWESGMLVRLLFVGIFLFAESVYAACPPSRDNTYVAGTVISPTAVTANEDNLYEALQDGITTDCLANDAVTTAKIATGAVTSADILDGTITTTDLAFAINPGNTLPAGAVFFMVTGTCPSWTTDVSATYANLFERINSTQGTTAGTNTHSHGAGTYIGTAHTHSLPRDGWTEGTPGTVSGRLTVQEGATLTHAPANADNVSGSGGGGATTGTSASADNIPQHITMRACRVD